MKNILEILKEYSSIIKLAIATLIPVAASVFFYLLKKKTKFGKIPHMLRQVIIGVVFGGIAIIGTEWGIPLDGAQVNCRDAAPLCAGLIFGGPAGIIAGLIGGIERWFAVYWGVGKATRVACSVSTAIAGFYAAGMRKFLFENRRPSPIVSLAAGAVMETFHLTMVLITYLKNPAQCVAILRSCTVPMIVANSLGVFFSTLAVRRASGKFKEQKNSKAHASEQMQRAMVVCIIIAFVLTSSFMITIQTGIAKSDASKYMKTAIDDIAAEIKEETAREETQNVTELLREIVQNRHIMETGYVVVAEKNGAIREAPDDIDVESIVEAISKVKSGELTTVKTDEGNMFAMFTSYENLNVISVLPCEEAYETRNFLLFVNTYMEVLVFAAMFVLIFIAVKKIVVKNVEKIDEGLTEITEGNLDKEIDVRSNAEFESLSNGINGVVSSLKDLMEQSRKKIAEELEVAKNIQASALPSVFPAFPNRKEFDIYALMTPAKEVGGDFYDFYLTEKYKLCVCVSDVSGKGVPAAMFMMRAKTMLKALAEGGAEMNDVFTEGNRGLCEGNEAGMFVTSWIGCLNLEDGQMDFANAGHNPPLLYHDGRFEYVKSRPGLILAGMDGMKYKKQELSLEKGDVLFLYTDGVTEATNANEELYGEERLQRILNSADFTDMKDLCEKVKADVDKFAGDAAQFDDITMLALRYNGINRCIMKFENASVDDIAEITEKAEEKMEEAGFPRKTIIQMNIAIDEIYSNIVRYAYGDGKGPATVIMEETSDPDGVELTFIDEGIPYNPVKKEDPDITLSAEERKIGGLGIFMVKKTMDDMTYEYKDEKNVLHLFKKK